ncbi:hypothetical protein QFZ37_001291 [Chryseobacterium ginsenosidimutans]|uniref:hypothetical protein n=1 Tax=Chryseobacterium ginsenosidimutans TaxID=687846 RepID=UPI00278A9105|nr:hypothetical protein [Chryseobacterium ginsenosidimutans]MDQ0592922.1 hypothetical protein [Chryseobacterium ginsenosidimutans]
MSAIKNLGLNIFFLIFLLLIFFSCNEKKTENNPPKNSTEIISINYSDIGGDLGNYKIVKITKDSIHLEIGITKNKIHKEWKSAITPHIWQNLISTIDIKTLDKIKSSPSKQSVDGFDETFQIRTSKKYHAYVNSYVDTVYYKQFQKLKDQIQNILPTEYK